MTEDEAKRLCEIHTNRVLNNFNDRITTLTILSSVTIFIVLVMAMSLWRGG